MMRTLLHPVLCCFLLTSCGVSHMWYAKKNMDWKTYQGEDSTEVLTTVFLVGDAGKPAAERQEPTLKALQREMQQCTSPNKAIIFLGDNVYHNGLEEEGAPGREESERRLDEQINIVKDFDGKVIFIPGNHDWNFSRLAGWDAVIRQEEYIEESLGREDVMYPGDGCPGPVEVSLGDRLVLILVDSEWWLHAFQKPVGPLSICDVTDEYDFIAQLNDALERNKRKNIILAMHHPLMTNGQHGGYYSLKDHIFPLTILRDHWYLPAPVIGSLYPLARMYGLSRQDLGNPRYRLMAESIKKLIYDKQNLVVVTGHDHNLQLHSFNDVYHIVSGSGSKVNYVTSGNEADFVARKKGYARLDYYRNGEVWVRFESPEEGGDKVDTLFRKPLYSFQVGSEPDPLKTPPDYTDSTITLAAGPEYENHFFLKRWILGEHYRREWTTPVTFRYLDMEREKGGLVPVKRGGGMQTSSLRLQAKDGNEYVLRSINKNPERLLPEGLRQTIAGDIFQDQISAAHPYAPLTIPPMAKALGIYHTTPEARYVPFTPSLGIYLDEYAGKPVFMEVRPDEDLSEFKEFGYSENAVGTDKMYEKLVDDNDNSVDAKALAKNRLFDILIGDWDRHEDQWRWAEFEKEGKGKRFVPIPRDRDQVYALYDGILPTIAASSFGKRNLSTFSHRIKDIKGLTLSGTHLERVLANSLTREDWVNIATEIKATLSDDIIEEAVRKMPPEIYAISGKETAEKLKSRRDDLPRVADRYYDVLAEDVVIFTSDKHEFVEVKRSGTETQVRISKKKKDGEVKDTFYQRTFYHKETERITIYTLGGNDSILLSGRSFRGPHIRIIGGEGRDHFRDDSKVFGLMRRTIYHDDNVDTNNTIIKGRETNLELDDKAYAHVTRYRKYEYDILKPIARLKYDEDNGLTIGLGGHLRTFGFRKSPYASDQKFTLSYTTRIEALSAHYKAEFPGLFSRKNDLEVDARYTGEDNKINYFGQGNETSNNEPIEYYRLNYFERKVSPSIVHNPVRGVKLRAGPRFEYVEFVPREGSMVVFQETSEGNRSYHSFYGTHLSVELNYLDSKNDPRRGVFWYNGIDYQTSFGSKHREFTTLATDFSIYYTPNRSFRLTMALRAGGKHIIGDYPFFKSSFLGGNEQLRGYRMTRFAGRTSAYQTLEARLKIHTLKSVIATGEYGVFTFVDNGRVWADNEISHTWHQGYGGGLWLNLFNLAILSGGVGFSNEGAFARFDYGFFF